MKFLHGCTNVFLMQYVYCYGRCTHRMMLATYSELEDILFEDSIDEMFNRHYNIEDAQRIYE